MRPGLLCIIAINKQHFEHICHLYRIERDQVKFIFSPNQLRGLPREAIVIFGEEWWRHKRSDQIDEIERLVKIHNERRTQLYIAKPGE